MTKLRVNYGGNDWHVDMTVEEFEKAYHHAKDADTFLVLRQLLDGQPHSKIAIRPLSVRYYYEEL